MNKDDRNVVKRNFTKNANENTRVSYILEKKQRQREEQVLREKEKQRLQNEISKTENEEKQFGIKGRKQKLRKQRRKKSFQI